MSVELMAGVVLGAVAGRAADIVLAPADALAEHWKERVKARLDRTREMAEAKSAGKPLTVVDRIAFKTLSEAAFTDDELTAEYLGGVLAASGPDDDTGAAVVALIGRLSALSLRLHYVIYRELRRVWPGPLNLYQSEEARRARIRIPFRELEAALPNVGPGRLGSIVAPLQREDLIDVNYKWGPPEGASDELAGHLYAWSAEFGPTAAGAEFFLCGHGVKQIFANLLFDPELDLKFLTEVPPTPSVTLLKAPSAS